MFTVFKNVIGRKVQVMENNASSCHMPKCIHFSFRSIKQYFSFNLPDVDYVTEPVTGMGPTQPPIRCVPAVLRPKRKVTEA